MNNDGIPNALYGAGPAYVGATPVQKGTDAVNAVDRVREAMTVVDFRGWCRGNAMIHMLNLEGEGKQAEWALWWMRMSVGDDPRK